MDTLPDSAAALASLVFLLGMKHGLDADHLATIDGLTRHNALVRPRLARWCGALFSAGHGLVVVAIALAVGTALASAGVPGWFDGLGAFISIAFLVFLGVLNLHSVFASAPHEVVRPIGLRGRLFAGLQTSTSPVAVAAIGALFALSFDTLSQAALFAAAGAHFGGAVTSLGLGLVFTAGMMVTDGANGLWISRLLRRADRRARVASRVMGLSVGFLSIGVAAWGVARYASPAMAEWGDGQGVAIGLACVVVVALSYGFATRLAGPDEPVPPRPA